MMLQLGLKANFRHQILEWDDTVIPMKDPVNFIGQPDLTKSEIREVVKQTAEPASTRETTERVVKIINSTHTKAYLDNIDAEEV